MKNFNFPGNQNEEALLNEIASLLRSGRKIEAIKVYRRVTGASLSDAKDALERMEQSIMLSGIAAGSAPQPYMAQLAGMANMGMELPGVLLAEIAQLLAQNKKIEAIKRYRQHTGAGLADAKSVVDQLEQQLRTRGM